MNAKLLRSCACLWVLGTAGMFATRALLGQEPGDFAFEVCARAWGVGGLGYLVVGAIQAFSRPS